MAQKLDDSATDVARNKLSPKNISERFAEAGANSSGQESPGFRVLLKMYQPIWNSFKENYLDKAMA